MNAKSGIGALLFVVAVFLSANTAWGQTTCGAEYREELPACAPKDLRKSPMALGSFVQWYQVDNHCGRDVEVYLRVNTGQAIVVRVEDGGREGASLPEGVEVTELLCCSERLSCDGSG